MCFKNIGTPKELTIYWQKDKTRQSLQQLVGSVTAHSTSEWDSSPFLGLKPAASLHSSLAARSTHWRGYRPHLSPRLLPFVSVTYYNMDYYSLTDPGGMEGWVGHVGWPIADSVTIKWSPIQLAQERESLPAEISVLPTMLCCQATVASQNLGFRLSKPY